MPVPVSVPPRPVTGAVPAQPQPQPLPLPATLPARPLPAAVLAQPLPPMPPSYDLPVGLQRTRYQPPPAAYSGESLPDLSIALEPPGPERIHKLASEEYLFQSWIEDARSRKERPEFPKEPVLSTEQYLGRQWPKQSLLVEPTYVNHGRLYYEELNAERYGWDLGFFSVPLGVAYFYKDVLLFPYHAFTDPCRCQDSSAGKCLPGDPVPYRLYPEGLSLSGAFGEAATIVALMAIFP